GHAIFSRDWSSDVCSSDLRRLIRHAAFAAATDGSRPFLTGVFVEVEQDEIRLVATDSSRLAFRRGKLLEETDRPRSGIVPVRALERKSVGQGTGEGRGTRR